MQFIQGNNRQQTYFSTLEDQVATDNPVRLIDAFIDKLDLQKLGFTFLRGRCPLRPPAMNLIFYQISKEPNRFILSE